MIVPYLWWKSSRDNQVHAFPVEQATEEGRTFFEAACQHTVPAEELTRTPEGVKDMACLLIVGDRLVQRRQDPGLLGFHP